MTRMPPLAAVLAVTACAQTGDEEIAAATPEAPAASAPAAAPPAAQTPPAPTGAAPGTQAQTPAAPAAAEMQKRQQAEAALRQLVTGLQNGNVDYSRIDERIANALRPQQAAMTARMAPRGPIERIEYLSTEANGEMQFRVVYANESSRWGVSLDAQGRISGLNIYD
jgi:hypothetical protein